MIKRVWALILIPMLLFYAQPAGAEQKEERKWQDESIYFLMIDRFNNGSFQNDYHVDVKDPLSYHGGDFQGILNKLDYIKDMGFTTIMLTPIFDNEDKGYHGYWVKDYKQTEEHFGTIEEFKTLVNEAHTKGIKVIIEFPVEQSQPVQPNETLIDAAKWWVNETAIDGYYIDEVSSIPKEFMTNFVEVVKKEKKDFFTLGRIKTNDPQVIAEYEETGIDGFLDYPLTEKVRPAFDHVDSSLTQLGKKKEELMETYKNPYSMGSLLDDHQSVRFTRDMVTKNQHPGPRWKLALTYMYTTPGIPIVYYGSEIALDGGLDTDNHKQMDFRTDKDLIDYITKLGELRMHYPSLTRGDLTLIAEQDGVLAYKRTYEGEVTVILLNNSSKSQNLTIPAEVLKDNMELRGLLTNDLAKSKNHEYKLFIDREEAEVYLISPKSGLNLPYVAATIIVYGAFMVFIIAVWRRSKKNKTQE